MKVDSDLIISALSKVSWTQKSNSKTQKSLSQSETTSK